MRREAAERAIKQWVHSKYFHATLSDDEYTVLLTSLMGSPSGMTSPAVVNDILQRLYPQHENFTGEKNMSTTRVVPSLESRTAPPRQTDDAVIAEAVKYTRSGHWENCLSEYAVPYKVENGLLNIGSKTNYALFLSILREIPRPVRVADIMERVMQARAVFERVPQTVVVEKPVEVAPEPDARELHNRQVKIDRAMNDRDTSPIRGAKEKAQPLIKPIDNSNLAEAAASEKAAQDNAIINEALSRINMFTGHSHSRTASGRASMREVFQAAMNEGKSASEVSAAVEAEASRLSGDSSIR